MKIGIICSRVRPEEKLLFQAVRKKNLELVRYDDRNLIFELENTPKFEADILLDRSINFSRSRHITKILCDRSINIINKAEVVRTCGDKILTTLALEKNNVPTVKVKVAFSRKSAMKAIEQFGYPVVLKPAVGSWGRLLSKIDNKSAAETILEHKQVLGSYHHSVFFINEFVEKPGRDIRAFVVGDETIGAIYRSSKHWITNTARGGRATNCPVTDEINEICLKTAKALGGGILALDLFETDKGLIVNEVNHTMEFRNSIKTTGVNIPEKMIEYLVEEAKK